MCFLFQEKLKSLAKYSNEIPKPSLVFEVNYNEEKNRKFEALKQNNEVTYAFHGSKFDNFYSILNAGLLSHLNKV